MTYRVNHKKARAALALIVACAAVALLPGLAVAQELPAAQSGMAGAANGPASDFPVVLGESYSVGATTYTPADTMNFDAVGFAAVDADAGNAISAADHTLPLPSYVEVTSLESGRTILVRVERRGPMNSNSVIALSAGAAAQLGISDNAAVRVRRVNPPESERATLRAGGAVAERMPTPKPLLAVLNRRLSPDATVPLNTASRGADGAMADAGTSGGPAMAPAAPPQPVLAYTAPRKPAARKHAAPSMAPAPTGTPDSVPAPDTSAGANFNAAFADAPTAPRAAKPAKPAHAKHAVHAMAPPADASMAAGTEDSATQTPAMPPMAHHRPKPTPVVAEMVDNGDSDSDAAKASAPKSLSTGAVVIQAGAFSQKGRAQAVASKIGAHVTAAGNLWRVRKGPYSSRADAEAALAKVKAAGIGDARIQRAD